MATYLAIVSGDVERSAMTLAPEATPGNRLAALRRSPEWWPRSDPWPEADQKQTRLALLKLQALFDFGASIPGSTALEIRDGIYQKFPDAKDLMSSASARMPGQRPLRIEVEACVRADGQADWGFVTPPFSMAALPNGAKAHFVKRSDLGGRTDLQVFVQNLVRADIYRRLEELL